MGSDPVSGVGIKDTLSGILVHDETTRAFFRARVLSGQLDILLHGVDRLRDLNKEELQQIVADLGREIQHLI